VAAKITTRLGTSPNNSNWQQSTMDSKAPVSSLTLFKETRTDLEPIYPGSLIQIQVPSTSTFSVRGRHQRRILQTAPTYKDEDSFSKRLTNFGSLFFSKAKRHPKSFLWRVSQEGKVLELRSVDLSKSNKETREASLTIQLWFPTTIKTGGVALADTEDRDALSLFVLTKGNELYTFTIRKDFFCRVAASEEDVAKWCKVSKPSTFSISTPHSLIAGSSLQLVVSLSDGRLLQLTRTKGEDGSKWHETTYGDGQWASSLRGLVRWQGSNTIKYDGTTVEQGTPIAMEVSPDRRHVFAVCLNHTLGIWNPNKAASVFSKDLLWQHREPYEVPKVMLEPGNSNVLQLFQTSGAVEGDLYYAITFSPHDFGQFKFWGVRDPDHGERGIRDLFPEYSLKPPDPDPSPESKAIWKVADFKVKSSHQGQELELWILMRSNRRHKLYNLKFEIQDTPNIWQEQWSTVALETLDDQPSPQISDFDPEDATDKWLNFVLYPGKYPDTVLETALSVYCSDRSVTLPSTKASLKERMCSAIALQVRSAKIGNDLVRLRKIIDQEWTVLWQDIRDLDKSRWDIVSLAYDDSAEMPLIVFADGSSAIRTCDRIEIIKQNSPQVLGASVGMLESPSIESDPGIEPKLPDELATIIAAAATFRQSFSYRLRQVCNSTLAEELWLDPSYSVPLRIQSFYDRCNFGEEIGSAAFDALTNALERIGGFNCLETEIFLAILDEFSHNLPPERPEFIHTLCGRRTLVSGAQEMIALRERLLSDLLVLVVFVDMEIDREEMPMENFDAPRIYAALLDLLRQYQIMQWLAKNTRAEKSQGRARPATPDAPANSPSNDHTRISSILENLFALDVPAQSPEMQSQSEALTHGIQDLLAWTMGGDDPTITMDQVPVYVQTNLLASNNIDLASDFLKYQPSTAWSTYIKGRLHLLKGETTEAAIYFKKAAFKLCKSFTASPFNSVPLTTSSSSPFRFRLPCRLPRPPQPHGRPLLRQRSPNILHPHPQPLRRRFPPNPNVALRPPRPPIQPNSLQQQSIRSNEHSPNLPLPSLPPNHRLPSRLLRFDASPSSFNTPTKFHVRSALHSQCFTATPVSTVPTKSPCRH